MKIAHVVCSFPPYPGGMGNVTYETARELLDLGHQVKVFTPKYNRKSSDKRIDFVERLDPVFNLENSAYLPQIGKKLDGFDLVHLHYPFYGAAKAVQKWKKNNPGTPLVITYHMDNKGVGLHGLFFKTYRKLFLNKILSSADMLIGASLDYIKHSHAAKFYRKNTEKWYELPFGIDTKRFQPKQPSKKLTEKFNIEPEKKTLLFVGGMDKSHYFKGVPVFLEAVKELKQKGGEVKAVLVGEGNMKQDYIRKSQELNISDIAHFTGFVEDNNLVDYYNLADMTILPSVDKSEAFGVVLLESMASGTPVVVSNLPGVRSVAKEEGEVFSVGNSSDLVNKIQKVFRKKEFDSNELHKKIAKKYDWENVVKKLENIYKTIS